MIYQGRGLGGEGDMERGGWEGKRRRREDEGGIMREMDRFKDML